MGDETFRSVLNEDAWVCRPQARRAGDLTVATPTYRVVGQLRRVRVMPARAGAEVAVVGRLPADTSAVYMEPSDVKAGDRFEVIRQRLRLAADAEAGEDTVTVDDASGVALGARLHLHRGTEAESVVVAAVGDAELTVAPSLRHAHQAGEQVWITQAHDVDGVCDEAGQGHHLKVLVRTPAVA